MNYKNVIISLHRIHLLVKIFEEEQFFVIMIMITLRTPPPSKQYDYFYMKSIYYHVKAFLSSIVH